jgi:hypothetical protein
LRFAVSALQDWPFTSQPVTEPAPAQASLQRGLLLAASHAIVYQRAPCASESSPHREALASRVRKSLTPPPRPWSWPFVLRTKFFVRNEIVEHRRRHRIRDCLAYTSDQFDTPRAISVLATRTRRDALETKIAIRCA